ncbi:MAG: cytochrome C oxidase subunit IV family protein [Aestuariibaculum sp.]
MMKNNPLYILIALILLTAVSALAANGYLGTPLYIILLASWLKFLLVGFYFMELRHAHTTWKWLLSIFSTVFFGLVLVFY